MPWFPDSSRGNGAIINISSIVSLAPELLNGVYGGTKAFVLAFSQSLHHELADKGIQIQAVLPGATATPFWDNGGLPLEQLDKSIVMSPYDLVDAALTGFLRVNWSLSPLCITKRSGWRWKTAARP
jgi:short-subunit dehydrogenase